MTRPPRSAGFTLIEVMISLLIFGLLAAAGVALLSFSVRAQSVTGAKLDDIAALDRLTSAMAADLAQAMPRAMRDDAGNPLPAFTGEAGSGATPMLRFVRGGWSNLDDAPRSGEQRVEYRIDDGSFDRVAYPMPDGSQPFATAPLLDHVRQVLFRYRVDGAWSDTWPGTPETPLPQAIEMRLLRSDGTQFRQLFLVGTGYRASLGTPNAS